MWVHILHMSNVIGLCKNYEICGKEVIDCGGCRVCIKGVCIHCVIMFRKELIFKDIVECPICLETKRGVTQPRCEHTVCVQCFRDCYFGVDYDEPEFPYSKEVEEEYMRMHHTSESFMEKYPLIHEYEKEYRKIYDKQQKMIKINSRCPLCRS